jgi:tRNA pseudouridine55 synthase
MDYGFLIINKPAGPTSHDMVDRIRHLTGIKTVGHAGTLDPFASGILLIGVGREATREFVKLVGLDKKYRATLRLGATSDTDDRTGQIKNQTLGTKYQKDEIETVLKTFTGKIMQVPPMYSAKKIHGKKLYELAREGKVVERQPVAIEIFSITVVAYPLHATRYTLVLNIHCSSGTYIRGLARDIGAAFGCGAYLEELERTAVGPFKIKEAIKTEVMNTENWKNQLISPNDAINRCQSDAPMLG